MKASYAMSAKGPRSRDNSSMPSSTPASRSPTSRTCTSWHTWYVRDQDQQRWRRCVGSSPLAQTIQVGPAYPSSISTLLLPHLCGIPRGQPIARRLKLGAGHSTCRPRRCPSGSDIAFRSESGNLPERWPHRRARLQAEVLGKHGQVGEAAVRKGDARVKWSAHRQDRPTRSWQEKCCPRKTGCPTRERT